MGYVNTANAEIDKIAKIFEFKLVFIFKINELWKTSASG